jgi:hypothetical protein
MAIRRINPTPTPKERAAMDRVQRAKKSYARLDRYGAYREAIGELAEETGADVEAAWSEWEDRVRDLLYTGEKDVDVAESKALEDIRERFRRAS